MSESLERWGDAAPAWLREAASAHAQEGPSEAELDRMLTRFSPAAPSGERGAQLKLRPRLGGALVLGALALTLLALLLTRASVPQPREAPQSRPAAPRAAAEATVPAAPTTDRADVEAATDPPVAPLAAGKAKLRTRSRGEATANALDELTLLVRARRVLVRDPERAYALTEQHRASYRQGALSEERELLAIEALVALGQTAAAEARAAQFAQRFPRSVHARKLGMILRGATP